MAKVSSSHSPQAESDLVDRLVEEYKILQDKIDKIGAFRFTIKGWSITIIIASIFAGSATKAVPKWLWGISLVVFLIVFFFFEKQQTDLSHRFGQRVLAIEGVLSRLLRNLANTSNSQSVLTSFLTLHFVPGIGHHLRSHAGRQRAPGRRAWQSYVDADVWFYVIQFVAVVVFVLWPAGTSSHDHTEPAIMINNNSSPSGSVTTESPTLLQPAHKDGRNTPPTAGENEKRSTTKKELESH